MTLVTLTVDIDRSAAVDALIAIERARAQGVYDEEQLERLTPLVNALRFD